MSIIEERNHSTIQPQLILVKHSLPVLVPFVAPDEWRLSEAGRQRAHRLGELLAGHLQGQNAGIYTSHEPKAHETASIAASVLGLPVQVSPGLHEHERQAGPLLEPDQFQAEVREFFARPGELVFGRETANQAHHRFHQAVHGLLEQNISRSLVVVAHGTVITLYAARLAGIDPFPFWQRLGLPSYVVLRRPGFELVEVVEEVGDSQPDTAAS